ncbi:glutathione S-transferase N-terminal domain-containing protein [Exercitatus varius]|uniref:glutathione S-transferase N-terminal domain-containing protein n=1 Tax=Exercitatus varius TaxID=67857 RepID=UPI00294B8C95|nr:glutathione S-transferase N-terminal domain-containing protein [Exercitatus varius]MDG2951652.1 glutathione S-transferase [Exercitatus varius]
MITLYTLAQSRSHRSVWLLEELGIPYQLQQFERDPITRLAPQTLKAIHPLGKVPVLQDGELLLAESGAITEYLLDQYGQDRLRPI